MKKKIKDLTLEECKNICLETEGLSYGCNCKGCPLYHIVCDDFEIYNIAITEDEDLEREVEVDESDND